MPRWGVCARLCGHVPPAAESDVMQTSGLQGTFGARVFVFAWDATSAGKTSGRLACPLAEEGLKSPPLAPCVLFVSKASAGVSVFMHGLKRKGR